ncbi:hypothetical protein E2542_SST11571 [Spatholobus suberectus]|nr:hypothetical protein E2542_SST11571 [Spatholobus suberectus]
MGVQILRLGAERNWQRFLGFTVVLGGRAKVVLATLGRSMARSTRSHELRRFAWASICVVVCGWVLVLDRKENWLVCSVIVWKFDYRISISINRKGITNGSGTDDGNSGDNSDCNSSGDGDGGSNDKGKGGGDSGSSGSNSSGGCCDGSDGGSGNNGSGIGGDGGDKVAMVVVAIAGMVVATVVVMVATMLVVVMVVAWGGGLEREGRKVEIILFYSFLTQLLHD